MSGSRTYRRERKRTRKAKAAAKLQKEEAAMIRQARVRVEKLRIVRALRDL